MGTEASLDQVCTEVKRMRLELKSIEKSLANLAEMLIPEEEAINQTTEAGLANGWTE